MIKEILQKSKNFLAEVLPPEGSDAYYGYSSERDDSGDEPDHLDINTPDGREAWNGWLAQRGLPALPPLLDTDNE